MPQDQAPSPTRVHFTLLKDLVPDQETFYNCLSRVNFVSLIQASDTARYKIELELIDGTRPAATRLLILGQTNINVIRLLDLQMNDIAQVFKVRRSANDDEIALFALHEDRNFHLSIMHERAPRCRELPSACIPSIVSFPDVLTNPSQQVALLIRINEVLHDALEAVDHMGVLGKINTSPETRGLPFMAGAALYLHRLTVVDGCPTFWPWSGLKVTCACAH